MKIYYDQDADLGQIRNKKVAIIGYGSQGHAHALNLKDSGVPVVVGLREGGSWLKAEKSGLKVMPTADAVKSAEIVMRSEEHTSELQSRFDLVCRLLLEKKNLQVPHA